MIRTNTDLKLPAWPINLKDSGNSQQKKLGLIEKNYDRFKRFAGFYSKR